MGCVWSKFSDISYYFNNFLMSLYYILLYPYHFLYIVKGNIKLGVVYCGVYTLCNVEKSKFHRKHENWCVSFHKKKKNGKYKGALYTLYLPGLILMHNLQYISVPESSPYTHFVHSWDEIEINSYPKILMSLSEILMCIQFFFFLYINIHLKKHFIVHT